MTLNLYPMAFINMLFKAKRIKIVLFLSLSLFTVYLLHRTIVPGENEEGFAPIYTVDQKLRRALLLNIVHPNTTNQSKPSLPDGSCNMELGYEFFTTNRRLTTLKPLINASCSLLMAGDTLETKKVKILRKKWKSDLLDEEFLQEISSCPSIVPTFMNNFYVSEQEKRFPLGYVILLSYSQYSIQQYIRLLRFIYRPQNIYCLHVDQKSPQHWITAITQFTQCFTNIFVAQESVEVVYASGSILTAHVNCLKELRSSQVPWKYAIDLHGTELPMVTNRDIVEALKPLNGINSIKSGLSVNDIAPGTTTHRKITRKAKLIPGKGMKLSHERLGPVPFNMTVYKSADSPNSAFSREFVNFISNDARAAALLEYLQDVLSAVEFFFNTLNNLEDAPGGTKQYFNIPAAQRPTLPNVVIRNWRDSSNPMSRRCADRFYRHRICIASASDLDWLSSASINHKYFFFNKYLMTYDHVVMDCIEELLLGRNLMEHDKDCGRSPNAKTEFL